MNKEKLIMKIENNLNHIGIVNPNPFFEDDFKTDAVETINLILKENSHIIEINTYEYILKYLLNVLEEENE